MAPETARLSDDELLQRIAQALGRAETAASRLDERYRTVRQAARTVVSEFDRLIAAGEKNTRG